MLDKNPFSIFDFLGYVLPGMASIYFCMLFFNYNLDYSLFENSLKLCKNYNFASLVFLVIMSYIVGHIISYLSSITVEKFSIWCYGYPSDFLITDPIKHRFFFAFSVEKCKSRSQKLKEARKVWYKYLWRLVVTIAILPLAIFTILASLTGLKYFYVKKLDNYLITQYERKWSKLIKYLGLVQPNGQSSDFHRITYHYSYENFPQHAKKLDNYVALYDFLRAMCFIMIIVTEFMFYFYFKKRTHLLLYYSLLALAIQYILFMAFMKFYRRFTLESIMCIIISQNIKDVNLKNDDSIYFCSSTNNITRGDI